MTRLKIISLFSGAGGLDYGFEAAGFETAVALDLDPQACAVLKENRPWSVLEGDLARISTATILDAAGLKRGDAAALIGGPPCQPFSKSGYWARGDAARLSDPRARTLFEFLRVLEDALPQTFLIENVPGLAYSGKSDGLQLIQRSIAAINARQGTAYSVSTACLNAADFGVPQLRHRVFVVGDRSGRTFHFPEQTHGGDDRKPGTRPYATAWDALGDLPELRNDPDLRLTGKWANLVASIPEGQNYLWHTRRGGGLPLFGWRRRYWNFLLKLGRTLPAWTIQAQPGPATGPFHWTNRYLSSRELMRLQTFPDDVQIEYPRRDAQRLVGNAVPSALAECLATAISKQMFEISRAGGLRLALAVRDSVPPAWPLAEVPKEFLNLLGDHSDHPGTGKGNRASAISRGAKELEAA